MFHFIYAVHMAYAMHNSPLEKGAKGVVNLSSWKRGYPHGKTQPPESFDWAHDEVPLC